MNEAVQAAQGAAQGQSTARGTARGQSTARGTAQGATVQTLNQLSGRLFSNPLVTLLVAGSAVIALLIALWMWAGAPEYRVLYSNLSEEDGGRIISELENRGIPYKLTQGGRTLMVPGDEVYKLRLQLAEQGLPQGANVGFEIMDNQAFGVSQFTEQVNYQRSLQGELASSIESLGPVSRARVHLSMPKQSVFIRDQEPAKASVVVTLAPGRTLGEGQVNAIVHLVSSSVPGLPMENVTVVDQAGRLLTRNGDISGLDGSRLDYVHKVERHYRQRIENILEPILGSGNVRAQVAAEIDFNRREETSERYTPNQDGEPAAVRSSRQSTDYDGNPAFLGGIPGALTNTPPGAAASPIQLEGDDGEVAEQTGEDDEENNKGRLRSEQLINYEVDRNITHIQHQRGQILRLSAAVVVNYKEVVGEDGAIEQAPLSDAELQHIEQLVRQAMGYSEARGDSLQVVNSPFAAGEEDIVEETPWYKDPLLQNWLLTLTRYLLVALLALILYRLILRPLADSYMKQKPPAAPVNSPQVATPIPEPEIEEEEVSPRRKRRNIDYERNVKGLQEMAQEDPALVAMIVRNWMRQNDQ